MGLFDFIFGTKKSSPTANKTSISEEEAQARYDAAPESVKKVLQEVVGSTEKPAQVTKTPLIDGSTYTGQAILCTNNHYTPYGYGKKVISKDLEMTGHWINGVADGVCYVNMHHSMVTGHFKNNRPNGWCMCIEPGGFVFGVFKQDDCVLPLAESFIWIIREIDLNLKTNFKKGMIFVGDTNLGCTRGFHFMNNGDLYIGAGDASLTNTGLYFKFCHNGYVQVGEFDNGNFVKEASAEDVIMACMGDPKLYKPFNTNKKYF